MEEEVLVSFDGFYKDILNKPPTLREQVVDLSQSPVFNPNLLYQKLSSLPSLEIREIYELLCDNYKTILHEICDNNNGFYAGLMLNDKFITAFTQAINNKFTKYGDIDYEDLIYCNKIVYSFFTSQYAKSDHLQVAMMTLCRTVNKKFLPDLLGKGFSDDQAAILVMNRFSTNNEQTNIQRLNSCILQYPIELMTVQNVVNIYLALFKRFTVLFETSMVNCNDVLDTEDKSEIYSRISLALLAILEEMPMQDIRTVLASYAGDYGTLYLGQKIRFSMNSLSMDYQRINAVVANMRHNEKIFLP